MDRLPDVPLALIFSFIDDIREKTRLERVSKRWCKIMRKFGWTNVHRISKLRNASWIVPIGERCGSHLAECSFRNFLVVNIDSISIRLIAEHFPALKHLDFYHCRFSWLSENALDQLRELGTRLHSLNLFGADVHSQLYHHLSHYFPRLQHLGLHLSALRNSGFLPCRFSADLRSLYLHYRPELGTEHEQILERVQRDCPGLMALYMDKSYLDERPQQLMRQISELKNLHILRISFDSMDAGLLCSCLDKLPQLIALNICFNVEILSDVLRSRTLRRLVHLDLDLLVSSVISADIDHYGLIGRLSEVAPQLRSLRLNYPIRLFDRTKEIVGQVLKIAHNGNLEYLSLPCGSFTIEILERIIRFCPNLHSLGVKLEHNEQLYKVSVLRLYVAYQWRTGARKHFPLQLWIYGHPDTSFVYRDPFLTIRTVTNWYDLSNFDPPNPVLEELFRDEVFSDGGGTPSFVTERYSSRTRHL